MILLGICTESPGPAGPVVEEGYLGLTWHLPCGLKASRSLTSESASWGRFFFFFLTKCCGRVDRFVCVCILNTLLLLLNTHTKCVEIWEEKIVKLGRVMEASGLGGDCLKSMFMEMSSRRWERTITSKNEVVDLLVLSAQNTWVYAQVCF